MLDREDSAERRGESSGGSVRWRLRLIIPLRVEMRWLGLGFFMSPYRVLLLPVSFSFLLLAG